MQVGVGISLWSFELLDVDFLISEKGFGIEIDLFSDLDNYVVGAIANIDDKSALLLTKLNKEFQVLGS